MRPCVLCLPDGFIASLFTNPISRFVLESTGNIPVDRKSKDRQVLFKGTLEALSKGYVVGLFPEGTSYTEPRIMQVKDGAAWAALEYTKWITEGKTHTQDAVIVPAAIVYTNKSKYRSRVCPRCSLVTPSNNLSTLSARLLSSEIKHSGLLNSRRINLRPGLVDQYQWTLTKSSSCLGSKALPGPL